MIEKRATLYLGTNFDKYCGLGKVIHWPMIRLSRINFSAVQRKYFRENLTSFDIIILTSRFSVKCFFENLQNMHYPLSKLRLCDFAVIGKNTAKALKEHNLTPKAVSPVETSQGLFRFLKNKYSLKGKKILFPRSKLPNPYLKKMLTKHGAYVRELPVYNNTKPPKRNLPQKPIDKVLFTSPSTVRNFLKDYRRIPADWKILSKGPVTQEALKTAGYKSEVISSDEIS